MVNEAIAGNTPEEKILPKGEEERLNYVADLLKAEGISKTVPFGRAFPLPTPENWKSISILWKTIL